MVGKYQSDQPWADPNRTIKEIKRLQTECHYRDARGVFFIEGVRNFVQVNDNNLDIVSIVYSDKLLTSPLARKLVRQDRRRGIPTLPLKPELFRKFSLTDRASGECAIVRQKWHRLDSIDIENGLCWVILGLVRAPGNFGTLIRTSEAIGGNGFILIDKNVDVFAPATVRASKGVIFRQRFVRTTLQSLEKWIGNHNGYIVGASPDGHNDFHHFVFPRPTLLFLGEERQGLSAEQRSLCDHLVSLPMIGQADSLNLGVAGSLLMYEIYRNWQS